VATDTRGKQIHLAPGAAHAAALAFVIGDRTAPDGGPQCDFKASAFKLEQAALAQVRKYLRSYMKLERSTEGRSLAGQRKLEQRSYSFRRR
jgi:hypothetical protein